jgi:amino acid permease
MLYTKKPRGDAEYQRIFAPPDPALSPDRLLAARTSPRPGGMAANNFRQSYYHRLAGARHARRAMPSDDPFTSLLRTRGFSVTDDQFSMDDSSVGGRESVNNSPNLRIREVGVDPEDFEGAGDPAEESKRVSLMQSVFNLSQTSVGAGTLSLPFFYKATGIVFGSVVLVVIAIMSGFSLNLLGKLAQTEKGCASYLTTAEVAYGTRGTKFVQISMFMLTFGAMVVYMIIIGSLSCQFLVSMILENPHNTDQHHHYHPSDVNTHGGWHNHSGSNHSHFKPIVPAGLTDACASTIGLPYWCNRNFIAVVFLLCPITPLSLKKNLRDLGFASLFGLSSVLYAIVLVSQDSVKAIEKDQVKLNSPGGPEWVVISPAIFFALPIVCLAYMNHPNVHAVMEELENPTRARVKEMILISETMPTVLYLIMGILGYMRFGDLTLDDILLNYTGMSWTNTVIFNTARLAMVLCLVVSFPLILFPCRMCLHALLKDALPDSLKHFGGSFYFKGETIFILVISYATSYLVPQIKTAFGLTGAITGCMMVYVLPPLFYMKIKKVGPCDSWYGFFSGLLMFVGGLMSIVCTTAIVYQEITGKS